MRAGVPHHQQEVFKLEQDAEWCMSMLGVLNQLTRHYITPKVVPPADFGQGLEGYTEFLDLTKKLCSKVSGQTLGTACRPSPVPSSSSGS